MPELEEVESATGQVTRSQNLVYTLPHTTESIAEFLTPALARVDPSAGGTQVVVVTRDAETALAVSETILRLRPGGIEVVPVTSAARAGRIFKSRPVLAVAGAPSELGALVGSSLLKLDTVRTVVLAWADDILDNGPQSVAALEALLGELGDASRVIVARKLTPAVEDLVERYARRARRVGIAEIEAPQMPENYELPVIRYVTVADSARGSALRRLLDDLDPPSAVVVARDEAAAADATRTIRTLGYHDDDSTIRVTRSDSRGPAHTVIFYQPPVTPAELQRVAHAKPVVVVVLAQPGEVASLRELASGRLAPMNLQGPERRAHDREEAVRLELRAILAHGVPARELISLEPLLEEFDAVELAAAALHVLERERSQRRKAEAHQPPVARARPSDGEPPTAAAGRMIRLFMTVGTRDGVKTGDLMGMIAGEGGIPGDHVGKIDLRESHALVEVAEGDAASVIARVNGAMVRGRRVVVRGERDKEERERSAGPRGDRPDRGGRGDRGAPPAGAPQLPGAVDRPTDRLVEVPAEIATARERAERAFHQTGGWVEVIAGVMFSGKSEELLRRVRRAVIARKRVQVFKSHLDARYAGIYTISSHDGRTVEAIPADSAAQIGQQIDPTAQVIAIDEAQFMDEGIVPLVTSLAGRGRRVIVAGTDTDFRGEPFGAMPELMAIAEVVDKLHAICVLCGGPASRNQRLIGGRPAPYNSPQIMVGGTESYEARCRMCHTVPAGDAAQVRLL